MASGPQSRVVPARRAVQGSQPVSRSPLLTRTRAGRLSARLPWSTIGDGAKADQVLDKAGEGSDIGMPRRIAAARGAQLVEVVAGASTTQGEATVSRMITP